MKVWSLPESGKDTANALPGLPLSIELPDLARIKELGVAGYARRCLETAKTLLKNI